MTRLLNPLQNPIVQARLDQMSKHPEVEGIDPMELAEMKRSWLCEIPRTCGQRFGATINNYTRGVCRRCGLVKLHVDRRGQPAWMRNTIIVHSLREDLLDGNYLPAP